MEYAKGVKGEIDQRPKRFYTEVSIVAEDGLWRVLLDKRGLRTSAGKHLAVPTESLAEAIATEWRAQGERIDLYTMHITRMAYGALDRTAEAWVAGANEAARFAGTDLVCYLADGPAALRDREQAAWGPLREWAGQAHRVKLEAVIGIVPKAQPEASLQAMHDHFTSLDPYRKAGLTHAIPLLGSAVLGLAVERGRLTAVEAYEISRVDEAFQAEQWGEDSEAAIRTARGRAEAVALDLWFATLPPL
jgi:chaperone required for assembly of F1-ATPase